VEILLGRIIGISPTGLELIDSYLSGLGSLVSWCVPEETS
jgi:hypothetical protein